MCDSIWITERECFPTVLMWWIQLSNHYCFWLSGRSSNIKQYVFLLCEPSFCHCCKVGWKLVPHVCEHMNYWKRVFSNCFDVLNPNIKSFLLLIESRFSNNIIIRIFILEQWFCHCCKVTWILLWCVIAYKLWKECGCQLFWCGESNYQIIFAFGWVQDLQIINNIFLLPEPWFCHCCKVTWKLVPGVWEHMNKWKRVVSNYFDVVNLIIKSFLLLVDCKIFK